MNCLEDTDKKKTSCECLKEVFKIKKNRYVRACWEKVKTISESGKLLMLNSRDLNLDLTTFKKLSNLSIIKEKNLVYNLIFKIDF